MPTKFSSFSADKDISLSEAEDRLPTGFNGSASEHNTEQIELVRFFYDRSVQQLCYACGLLLSILCHVICIHGCHSRDHGN